MTTTTVPEAQQEMESQHERRAALRISFVGAGTMAEAIIRGLLQRKVVEPGDVVASAPRAERRAYLVETYGLRAVAQNAEAARDVDVVLLCVKPQTVPHVLPELREVLDTRQLVISIAAGVSLETLESLSYHPAIGTVRALRCHGDLPTTVGVVCHATAVPHGAGRQMRQ